ncbi:MAG: tetratricopeptide repeat protein [Magnetococcales bacterium]|nr:tetratricopeptide repeat protein [Magnetococcales bacterium]
MDAELKAIYQLADQKRYPQALKKLRSFLSREPKNDEARFLLGLILTEQKKRDQAIAVFQALTRERPEYPEPFNNLAVLYADQGHYEKARQALIKALETHPSYATAQENLGDIYAKMAARSYRKALQQQKRWNQKGMAKSKLALITHLFDTTPAAGSKSRQQRYQAAPARAERPTTPSAPPQASTATCLQKIIGGRCLKPTGAVGRVAKANQSWGGRAYLGLGRCVVTPRCGCLFGLLFALVPLGQGRVV